VGKALEHARMEVIEEFEEEQLKVHKKRFAQNREAQLMETQRVEAIRQRRTNETERRNLQ
jgi:hypothetical protein